MERTSGLYRVQKFRKPRIWNESESICTLIATRMVFYWFLACWRTSVQESTDHPIPYKIKSLTALWSLYQTASCQESSYRKNTSAPDTIDWRKMGAVLPVINQGAMGKSTYFVTTDTVSSTWYQKTGNLVSLSVQQLNDCAKTYFDLYQYPYIIDAKGYSDFQSTKNYFWLSSITIGLW